MTTIIETSNGWWFASATVTCSPTASAPTPRRGVGLIVKTARRSHAPNTWRGQLDWRRARLHGRPTRSVKDEQDLRDRDAARVAGQARQADSGA